MKRVRNERWGPRTLDIDILAYDAVEMSGPRLELPHPRMTERAFVLMPLADMAPDLAVGGKRVAAWLNDVDQAGIEVVGEGRDWWRI